MSADALDYGKLKKERRSLTNKHAARYARRAPSVSRKNQPVDEGAYSIDSQDDLIEDLAKK